MTSAAAKTVKAAQEDSLPALCQSAALRDGCGRSCTGSADVPCFLQVKEVVMLSTTSTRVGGN